MTAGDCRRAERYWQRDGHLARLLRYDEFNESIQTDRRIFQTIRKSKILDSEDFRCEAERWTTSPSLVVDILMCSPENNINPVCLNSDLVFISRRPSRTQPEP
jgi:hypothetical protein